MSGNTSFGKQCDNMDQNPQDIYILIFNEY